MLNTRHFALFAGNPVGWDRETVQRSKRGEALPAIQQDQYHRGRRSLRLYRMSEGWALAHTCAPSVTEEDHAVVERGSNLEDLIQKGIEWAEEDPENREFFAARRLFDGRTHLLHRYENPYAY